MNRLQFMGLSVLVVLFTTVFNLAIKNTQSPSRSWSSSGPGWSSSGGHK